MKQISEYIIEKANFLVKKHIATSLINEIDLNIADISNYTYNEIKQNYPEVIQNIKSAFVKLNDYKAKSKTGNALVKIKFNDGFLNVNLCYDEDDEMIYSAVLFCTKDIELDDEWGDCDLRNQIDPTSPDNVLCEKFWTDCVIYYLDALQKQKIK